MLIKTKIQVIKVDKAFLRKGLYIILSAVFGYVIGLGHLMAHHLRAGDITMELISCQTYTYQLTITGYTDNRVPLEFGYEVLDFGDGTFINLDTCTPVYKKDLDDFITVKTFKIEHTFPGPGNFTVRYHEPNRNDNVLNMHNSGYVAFYVETQVIIDPFLFCNNTPVLLNPPVDKGVVGQVYEHNPAAWDPDGDSLAYKLIACKQNRDMTVPHYQLPHIHDIEKVNAMNAEGTGPATMTMNPVTGNITWDAPGLKGQYNIAFMVEEWRKIDGEWHKLGYVTRDMQILIEDSDNHPPKLYLPKDTCIVAGTTLNSTIYAEDPDEHDIIIEAFSGIFKLFGSAITLDPDSVVVQSSPASLRFEWRSHCSHVRKKPYEIIFKATDNPVTPNEQPPLVDFDTWFVTIIGPAPTGLTVESTINNDVLLQWDPYQCHYANKIQIWRRIGNYTFKQGYCDTGIPESSGYQLIDEVSITDTSYLDTGKDKKLTVGAKYCYRLVAVFPLPGAGESYPSKEECVILGIDKGPVITHVDVNKTDEHDGSIIIRWTSPKKIRENLYRAPFRYQLYRKDSLTGEGNQELITILNAKDTLYKDTQLNTLNFQYYYQVCLLDDLDTLVGQSGWASSVRLNCKPVLDGVSLSWEADVPWSINSFRYPMHYVYRDGYEQAQPDELILIDSVNVNKSGFHYIDRGQSNEKPLLADQKYHYYITTSGSYGNPNLPEPLINRSQVIGTYPNDTIPPCTPLEIHFGNITSVNDCREFIEDKPCDFHEFFNEIWWEKNVTGDCDPDNSSFNVYFSSSSEDGPYMLIANVKETFFIHQHLESFAGCYRIAALDNSGNESEWSEPVCHDNCPYYELPNVFTPNNDGKNDSFKAFDKPNVKCPRFVHDVNFRVYNRNGFEVFNSDMKDEPDPYINWDGRDYNGNILPTGVYYYIAEVNFIAIDPNLSKHIYKGWVHILR